MNPNELDPYLLRKLEECSGFYARSFSNRYGNWKRTKSIERSLLGELKRRSISHGTVEVLDIGCGDGWLIYRLKCGLQAVFSREFNIHFTGIDVSNLDIDFANKRKEYFGHKDCDFQVMDAKDPAFKDEQFDVIVSSEVIEHMEDPGIFIKNIRRILRKGGLVILTTPNAGGGIFAKMARFLSIFSFGAIRRSRLRLESAVISKEEKELSRFSSSQGHTGAGLDHVSVFSVALWEKLFRKNGFLVQSAKGTGGFWYGDQFLDEHRVIFSFSVIADALLEYLPGSYLWSETLFFELRKT